MRNGVILLFALVLLCGQLSSVIWAADKPAILVVFSYEEEFPWDQAVRQGIEAAFRGSAELRYFYMNTKVDLAGGEGKAEEALALYRALQPDGVIAIDDNAQSLFVVPFLRGKVSTPVVFCGVNADPSTYGYPADNVSGVLERFHIEETIAFSRQFQPQIKTFAFIIKQSPVAKLVHSQLTADASMMSARLERFAEVTTREQTLKVVDELQGQVDLLFIESLQGVTDGLGRPVPEKQLVGELVQRFAGPTAATNAYTVHYGALAAVIKSGREQGRKAVAILQQALAGTPLSQLPITRNYHGRRMLNVTTMRQLGISPSPMALRGVELVRTDD